MRGPESVVVQVRDVVLNAKNRLFVIYMLASSALGNDLFLRTSSGLQQTNVWIFGGETHVKAVSS